MDNPEGMEAVSTQFEDTRRITVQALSEPDAAYLFPENKLLKEKWLDQVKESLSSPTEDPSVKTVRVNTFTDASLAFPPNRGFVAAFLHHMGTTLKIEDIQDIATGAVQLPRINKEEINGDREAGIVIVENANGGIESLVTDTKIDGLRIIFDGSAITAPTHADRTVRPMLSISTT